MSKKVIVCILSILFVFSVGFNTQAAYPEKPITIIVSQDPGSSLDITTRIISDKASEILGEPIVIKNIIGAGGRTAYSQGYRADPDGYTFLNVNVPSLPLGELVFNGQYKSQEYEYIFGWVDSGHVLTASSGNEEIQTFKDFLNKISEEDVTIGTFSRGSSAHLQMAAFLDYYDPDALKNTRFVHFDGGTPAMNALIGGHIETNMGGYGGYSRTDNEKIVGLADFRREGEGLDGMPTIPELGFEDAPIVSQMWGLVGPPGVSQEIVKVISDAFTKASKDSDVIEQFNRMNLKVKTIPYEEFHDLSIQAYEISEKYLEVLED